MDETPFGICNVGATCYINTCLTSLGHCPSFLNFVLSFDVEKHPNSKLMKECAQLYTDLWLHKKAVTRPQSFILQLKKHLSCLDILDQNDLGEFLVMFIDKLNMDICIDIPDQKKSIVVNNLKYRKGSNYDAQRRIMDDVLFNTVKKEYSEIIPLFYGQNIAQIICGHCQKIHHTYEMFSSLLIPIVNENETSESLYGCLEEYFKKEMITQWTCDKCKETTTSCKSLLLWRTPDIMIFVLKRFKDNMVKNNKRIDAPLELDMSPFTLDLTSGKYKLVSIGCHVGTFNSGHYFSLCKQSNNKWFVIDDLDVKEVDNPELGYGYVYFYEKM